jgi:hypothetical protein
MSNNFNFKNYAELLNKQDLSETDEEQFFSYGVSLEGQISYNRKEEYFSLIKNYFFYRMLRRKKSLFNY